MSLTSPYTRGLRPKLGLLKATPPRLPKAIGSLAPPPTADQMRERSQTFEAAQAQALAKGDLIGALKAGMSAHSSAKLAARLETNPQDYL